MEDLESRETGRGISQEVFFLLLGVLFQELLVFGAVFVLKPDLCLWEETKTEEKYL